MIKRWVSLFFIGNMVAFWLLGLLYLPSIAWVNTGLLKGAPLWVIELNLYTLVSYLGQLGILSFIPLMLVWPAIYLFRSQRFIIFLSILLAWLSLCLLVTDIVIYHLYRFHLNGVIFQFFLHSFNKEFFDLSARECVFAFVILCSILILESLYAYGVWHFVIKKAKYIKLGKKIAVLLVFCISISYAAVLFSLHTDFNRIFVETSRFLPFYEEGLNTLLPKHLAIAIMREGQFHEEHGRRDLSTLHYPTKDLQFGAQKKLPNLLVILIDAWRYDMLSPMVTPSLYQFSKQSWVFSHHFSGGNATGPGVFSIFYGIPATYWPVMETQGRGPLFFR